MNKHEDQIPDILLELKSKGDGFRTAESDYFSDLTARVLSEADEPKVVKMRPSFQVKQWLAYAAALALIVVTAWQLMPATNLNEEVVAADNTSDNVTLDDLDDATILEYLGENLQDYELEQLALDTDVY